VDDLCGLTDAALAEALAFISEHPRCSVIDLERRFTVAPGQVWRLVHELENRRLVRVDSVPAGWQFTVR